jgi:hypothetical protein
MNKSIARVDQREGVAVAHSKGTKHRYYEDSLRILIKPEIGI